MENAKNFILSLKFPFSLVKENRFLWDALSGGPKEGGGAADADKGKKVEEKDSGEVIPADAALDKKREENLKRDMEIDKELDDISKKSNLKETQLASIVEEFRKKPEPVSDEDKQNYDKEVAAIRLELMAMTSKRKALMEERKALNAYKDPRIEAFDAKARVEQLKGEIEEGKKKFFDGLMSRLDAVKIAERRAEFKINADKWDITSKSGLDAVKKDWIDLKIFENTPFFQNIFAQLEKLAPERTAGLPDDTRKLYLNPEANVNKIEDKALAAAISFFVSIKELLKTQDNFQMAGDARSQEKDQDKIASTGIKFVTDNVRKFHDAIKQKDWGTAAVYLIGAYIAYQ